jgi:hypothetical protein
MERMSEFTKGPWVSGYGEGITGPTTPTLHGPCCAGEKYPYDVVSKGTETIAIIPRPCSMDGEMKANADLISAAPDMYKALEESIKAMISTLPYIQEFSVVDEIIASIAWSSKALAKARGESHE